MKQTPICHEGVTCTHEGPCTRICGGDHYYHTDGGCLRCGKYDPDKASDKPLARKNAPLQLWNGRWLTRGDVHCYVAAYSQRDAANLAIAAGLSSYGIMNEIRTYWHAGCWGYCMDGITPERGIWLSRGNEQPERVVLACDVNARLPEAKPKAVPAAAPVVPQFDAARAKALRWRSALVEQIAEEQARIDQSMGGANEPGNPASIQRLALLKQLLALE
jgi:hypothetical protein